MRQARQVDAPVSLRRHRRRRRRGARWSQSCQALALKLSASVTMGCSRGPCFGCTTARSGRDYLSSRLRALEPSQCGGCGGPREGERRRAAATVAVVVKAIAKCCYCRYCYCYWCGGGGC